MHIAAIGAVLAPIAALAIYLARAATAHRRPRPVRPELLWGEHRVQLTGDGTGTLFHRRYRVEIAGCRLRPHQLMDRVKADLPRFSPKLLAKFRKIRGHPRVMREGDEYTISILGPWNGDVRVVEVTDTSFTFVTLEGHPEAGQITFAVTSPPARPGVICFEINSWARSRDMLVSLSYDQGKIGKEVQKSAWVTFCERVVRASGGRRLGDVEVVTEERNAEGEVIPVE